MKRGRIHNLQFTPCTSIANIRTLVEKLQSNFCIEKHESRCTISMRTYANVVFCSLLQIYIFRNTHKILCTLYHKYVAFENTSKMWTLYHEL